LKFLAAGGESRWLRAWFYAMRPQLRLLPTLAVSPTEAAVDAAVDAALDTDFRKTVAALRKPISALAAQHGEAIGEVSADDAETWWTEVAVPVLTEVARKVVLNQPGQSPANVVDAAILDVIAWLLVKHEEAETTPGALPPTHPARLKRLVLIVASEAEPLSIRDHALAMALVFSGAAARVISGPITGKQLTKMIKLTGPAVIVVPKCPQAGACPQGERCPERLQMTYLAEHFAKLPVVEAPAVQSGGKGFAALVTRVLAKCPDLPDDDAAVG